MYEEHIRLCESICVNNIGVNKRAFHFIYYEVQTLAMLLKYYFRITISNEEISKRLQEKSVFISFSLVLSGITRTSNYNIEKRLESLFRENEEICSYFKTNSDTNSDAHSNALKNTPLRNLFNLVQCLQMIHDDDLRIFQRKDDLILYIDYADRQLIDKVVVPWFCGRSPELVRYFKSLSFVLYYLRNDSRLNKNAEELYRMYDFIFSHMSEHEVALFFVFSQADHELFKILGMDHLKSNVDINQKWRESLERENEKVNFAYSEISKKMQNSVWYLEIAREVSNENPTVVTGNYEYYWINKYDHQREMYIDEVVKSVAITWMYKTNEMYNYFHNGLQEPIGDTYDKEIYTLVYKMKNMSFEQYKGLSMFVV